MEYQYLVRCPHCNHQQNFTLESKNGGEVTCEECEKPYFIAVSSGEVVHSHPDKESADRFLNAIKNVPDPFAKYDCPHCGKKLAVRNYFRDTGKIICNHCDHVVFLIADSGGGIKVGKMDGPLKTIFDPDFSDTPKET